MTLNSIVSRILFNLYNPKYMHGNNYEKLRGRLLRLISLEVIIDYYKQCGVFPLTVMVLLAVSVRSILDPNRLHVTAKPVPPHATSTSQPRSVVRDAIGGIEIEPFAAAKERQVNKFEYMPCPCKSGLYI